MAETKGVANENQLEKISNNVSRIRGKELDTHIYTSFPSFLENLGCHRCRKSPQQVSKSELQDRSFKSRTHLKSPATLRQS